MCYMNNVYYYLSSFQVQIRGSRLDLDVNELERVGVYLTVMIFVFF